jgi:hypothetical protein
VSHDDVVTRWICPSCEREFGRARQSHVCVPGCTVEETFAGRPGYQRAAYDLIAAHLGTLGPLYVDAVRVGVFLSGDRKFAEVRPKARSLSVALSLPRPVRDPRVARCEPLPGGRVWNYLKVTRLEDVDEEFRAWLTEAYDAALDGGA